MNTSTTVFADALLGINLDPYEVLKVSQQDTGYLTQKFPDLDSDAATAIQSGNLCDIYKLLGFNEPVGAAVIVVLVVVNFGCN